MSVFTENINIAPLPKENLWITTATIRFYLFEEWIWEYIDIPEWYKFDWASIPRLFWILFAPAEPKTITPAVLHDYLTDIKQFWYFLTHHYFYVALRISWNGRFKSSIFFIWVCLFGWISYYNIIDRISGFIRDRLKLSEDIWKKL